MCQDPAENRARSGKWFGMVAAILKRQCFKSKIDKKSAWAKKVRELMIYFIELNGALGRP